MDLFNIQKKGNLASKSLLTASLGDDLDAKQNLIEATNNISGINLIDALSAYMRKDFAGNFRIDCGIPNRFITLVGSSGLGKTTLALILGGAITELVEGGVLYFFDIENNIKATSRPMELMGWNENQLKEKYRYFSNKTNIVDIMNVIRKIVDFREKNKKIFQYESNFTNLFNEKILIYPPTAVIIDSMAALTPKNDDIETLHYTRDNEVKNIDTIVKNTDGMIMAKEIRNFIDRLKTILNKYNIVLIAINHEKTDIEMGFGSFAKKHNPNLEAGVNVKGGSSVIYQSYMMIRLKYKGKIEKGINYNTAVYGDNIQGIIVEIKCIKNKSASSNIPVEMIFDKQKGYLSYLSDFEYIKKNEYGISGSSSFKLHLMPEISFKRSNLYDLIHSNQLFARTLYFTARQKIMHDFLYPNENNAPDLLKFYEKYPKNILLAIIWSKSIDYPFIKYNSDALIDKETQDNINSGLKVLNFKEYDFSINDLISLDFEYEVKKEINK